MHGTYLDMASHLRKTGIKVVLMKYYLIYVGFPEHVDGILLDLGANR